MNLASFATATRAFSSFAATPRIIRIRNKS
jgi:hypothetical protein